MKHEFQIGIGTSSMCAFDLFKDYGLKKIDDDSFLNLAGLDLLIHKLINFWKHELIIIDYISVPVYKFVVSNEFLLVHIQEC